jgi:hypothetical protein
MKVGIVLTTHKDNWNKIKLALEGVLKYCNYSRYIIVFDNEGTNENTKNIPNLYPEVKYYYIKNQKINGGLTGTWNQGIDECLNNDCDLVILLNHDIEINDTFHFLIEATMRENEEGIYSCTTDKGPWGNRLNQESYIRSNELIVDKFYDDYGPGGFCLSIPKSVLIKNKFNEKFYFDPKYPFGDNERFYAKRWYQKNGYCYMVRNCFIRHDKDNSW